MEMFTSITSSLKLKLVGTTQVRRVTLLPGTYPTNSILDHILEVAEERFGCELQRGLIQYEDLDGDLVTATSNDDLSAALFGMKYAGCYVQPLAKRQESDSRTVVLHMVPSVASSPDEPLAGGEWEVLGLGLGDIAGAKAAPNIGGPTVLKPEPEYASELLFWINGQEHRVAHPDPSMTLVDYLHCVGLTGTKVGCGEGGCGCCTVTLSTPRDGAGSKVTAINACLRSLCAVDSCAITTTEGLGSKKDGYHIIQETIADSNGSQCGYCTPGWVMNMYSLMESQNGEVDLGQVERHFDGNLCRCTGYRPILQGFKTLACSKESATHCRHDGNAAVQDIEDCGSRPTCGADGLPCQKYKPAPPLAPVITEAQASKRPLHFVDSATGKEWYRPVSLDGLLSLRARLAKDSGRQAKLVCGNTASGVEKYFGEGVWEAYQWDPAASHGISIDVKDIPELQQMTFGENGATFGAAVTISDVIATLDSARCAKSDSEGSAWATLAHHLRRVANVQVRNAGSWAGNLCLAKAHPSFPSDLSTIFAAAGATIRSLNLSGQRSKRTVEEFLATPADEELVVSITIPVLEPSNGRHKTLFSTYKVGARHVNAAAIVNAGFSLTLHKESSEVQHATAFFNGLAGRIFRARSLEKALVGEKLSEPALQLAILALSDDLEDAGGPNPDPRHSAAYRLSLAESYVYKLFLEAQHTLPPSLASALVPFAAAEDRSISHGKQVLPNGNPSVYPVSKGIPKLSSRAQAAGEAQYTSTMPDVGGNQLHGCLVYAHTAAARLLAVDPSEALGMPGVVSFITATDIPGYNQLTFPIEPLFFRAGEFVPSVGSPLGFMVATSATVARVAAKAVRQCYEPADGKGSRPLTTLVVTNLEQAKRAGRAADETDSASALRRLAEAGHHIRRGLENVLQDPEPFSAHCGNAKGAISRALSTGDGHVVSGTMPTGGQKHFYMEPMATLAIPQEDGCMEIISGTQDTSLTQQVLSEILSVPQHALTVKVRRMGGGFGAKLTRSLPLAGACAVAAAKLSAPVRGVNERLDDMVMTGGREEMTADYTVAFSKHGVVDAIDMDLAINTGWYTGDTSGDLAMAVSFSDNAYFTPNYSCNGTPFNTDIHPNTACRAPGVVQTILAHEAILEHVAKTLGLPMDQVQEKNFYQHGQATPAGVIIGTETHNWTLPEMWHRLKEESHFLSRRDAITDFNASNKWRKKGISMAPVRYGINTNFYKSGALVNIYMDGTVLVATGGCEAGQGLNTKAAQVAAHVLGVDLDKVKLSDTDTSKVPFNTCTGGSGTSESTAKAVEDACLALRSRLLPYLGDGQAFADGVKAAMDNGVPLSATGWWADPVQGDKYSSCGVACSEVEVDVLSGEMQILRTDILMDLGTAMNPEVDLGQLEGGFMMALGYILMEDVLFDERGQPLSIGTWNYKIPSAYDIPIKLNVELTNTPNPSGVYKSKASAEPPMGLVNSVFFAVKEAIYAAREMKGETEWFQLASPITVEAIRQACLVDSTTFGLA